MSAPGGPQGDYRRAPPEGNSVRRPGHTAPEAPAASGAAASAPPPAGAGPGCVQLSLVAHTNVGKTTLARTLLQRDVGEVRDAPHVTEFADAHEMLCTPQGETLRLWDTPGFGDSLRLLRRMEQSGNPLGWFLGQVWDRWRDRPFWASQQALRHVAATSDVLLYLVNAAEEPQAAGYIAPEMALLAWVGKPVIVLLNQLGPPRAPAVEQAELQRWREHLAPHAIVAEVLSLDAFARCWVQEGVLLAAVERVLAGEARARMQRLRAAWAAQQRERFDAAVQVLAESLGRSAASRQALDGHDWKAQLRAFGAALGLRRDDRDPARLAQAALAAALDEQVQQQTVRLLELHRLPGKAQREILERVAGGYELRLKLDEGRAALIGGAVSGALAGLKADVATGGLTLGGGLLAGGLLGALGAAGLARAVNLVRGLDASYVAWNAEALDLLLQGALLRYLAVAHYGRGRGEWSRAESPPHWQPAVADALAPMHEPLEAIWLGRDPRADAEAEAARLAQALHDPIAQALQAVLARLYPDSPVPPAALDAAGASG
jgi:hypothetical protein